MQTNVDDDDITVIASNTTTAVKARNKTTEIIPNHSVQQQSMAATARAIFGAPGHDCLQKMSQAIMDTGATAIFIMEGTPVDNKRIATEPLTSKLPSGTKIKSTIVVTSQYQGYSKYSPDTSSRAYQLHH